MKHKLILTLNTRTNVIKIQERGNPELLVSIAIRYLKHRKGAVISMREDELKETANGERLLEILKAMQGGDKK